MTPSRIRSQPYILVLSTARDSVVWREYVPPHSIVFVRWTLWKVLDIIRHRTIDVVIIDGFARQYHRHLIDLLTLIRIHAPSVPIYLVTGNSVNHPTVHDLLELRIAGLQCTMRRDQINAFLLDKVTSSYMQKSQAGSSLPPPRTISRTKKFRNVDLLRSQGYTYADIAAILDAASEESVRKLWQRGRNS